MRETIDFVKEDCTGVSTSNYYAFMMQPYFANTSGGDCAVVAAGTAVENCTLSETVSKSSVRLIDIYKC